MREFSRYGIRVGAIAPGLIETPMTAGMNEKALERLRASVPLGRIGKPEDIFVAVKFIIECDFFTGQTIDVDGGGAGEADDGERVVGGHLDEVLELPVGAFEPVVVKEDVAEQAAAAG